MTATQGRQKQCEVGEAEALMRLRYKTGADDGATESSTHGRGQGHNDLLILSLSEADVSQQVVCHSSRPCGGLP